MIGIFDTKGAGVPFRKPTPLVGTAQVRQDASS
jgi:hypothetical protein